MSAAVSLRPQHLRRLGGVLNNQEPSDHKTEKVVRLVDYLLRLASLRTKMIRDITSYEKVLWVSSIPHQRGCFTQGWGADEEHEPDEWMEVRSWQEPELPAMPARCKAWVDLPTLRNKNDLPGLIPEITRQIPNPDWRENSEHPETIPRTERLEDLPEVQQAWDRYVEEQWLPWTEEHNTWETVQKVYSDLFAIYQAQLRLGEEYELVLGLGLLTWQSATSQRVRRHMVVADATLDFEARLGKFTVRPHTEGAKLRPELDMLEIDEPLPRAEEIAKASLDSAEDDPWEKGIVEGVLRGLVHSINSQGDYDDSLEAKNIQPSAKPVVEYAPALILRKRSAKGLTETLKRIKEQIETGETVPGEFGDLAEIGTEATIGEPHEQEELHAPFDGEVFFPKQSNEEQRRIVDKIRHASGVLVQGPPGTGKSHTIANLICHLLATGQRTLITAKTPRALQVLDGLIPDELRPLCINLLGSGLDERRSLESSVGGILRKNGQWSELHADRERYELEERLQELREEKTKLDRRLRDIRESETHTQSIAEGAYHGTAARIAEAVNRDRATYGWFTDSVPLDKTCQVSTSNLRKVLVALRELTQEKLQELGLAWPDALPTSEGFTELVRNEKRATDEVRDATHEVDEWVADVLTKYNPSDLEAIQNAFSTFRDTRRRLLAMPHSWIDVSVRDILGDSSAMWHELLRVTRHVIGSVEKLVPTADEIQIEFPDTIDIRVLFDDAIVLKQHMENGGKLGWGLFRPKPVKERLYVIKSVTVAGRSCSTAKHLSTLADVLYVRIEFEKAWGFWQGRSKREEGPLTLQLTSLKSLNEALERALALEALIAQCREALSKCPEVAEPVWTDESQIEKVASSCRLALVRIQERLAKEEIQKVEASISRFAASSDNVHPVKANWYKRMSIVTNSKVHPVTDDLLGAIRGRDVAKFTRCVSKIDDLNRQLQRLQTMDEYLSKLRRLLPDFTKSLEETSNEPYWDERVESISNAWQWAQARYWIEEYISKQDVQALTSRSKQIEDEIGANIARLAALHAWSFCFSRLKEEHRRHMEAWQQSIRRLGKGTGKHAPRHRREAQGHLNDCREAVPAWVMPLHRVWDTVLPSPGMFDVIIVDEASQCGLEALPLFYLGRKILIVGDDKQISPDAVGLQRNVVHRLMEELLHDFEFKSSFDIESSLFDHGKLRYGTSRITLREHFRCMPEIIQFSNDLCYANTPLIPLRQYGPDRLPPLEHVFVRGGYREGANNRAINRPEAEAIVERIIDVCDDRRYDGKTLGVVVLQGEAQAALIESQLLEQLGAAEMERRRLVCGNPYSFQGDERDIILLSLVAAANKRIGSLTKSSDERRFNVAASRARDMMILFHSVTIDDLGSMCLRRQLLQFFENTKPQQIAGIERVELEQRASLDNRGIVNPPAPFDSWFEIDVALELLRKGFTVLAQYEVAGKLIDLVVEGGQARLAIECDGDHWHGADRYDDDMQRQRQLERCGWEFFRVRESAFYASKEEALAGLWRVLQERGINPNSERVELHDEVHPKNEQSDSFESEPPDEDGVENRIEYDFADSTESELPPSGRRAEDVSAAEIKDAILHALLKCPNYSCTLHSLTARVLKEVGVLTRGRPREAFEDRTLRCVKILEKGGRVETYRAKNQRLRLAPQELE